MASVWSTCSPSVCLLLCWAAAATQSETLRVHGVTRQLFFWVNRTHCRSNCLTMTTSSTMDLTSPCIFLPQIWKILIRAIIWINAGTADLIRDVLPYLLFLLLSSPFRVS